MNNKNISKSGRIHTKRGASTVEYLVMFAAIIGVLIVFLNSGGVFDRAWQRTMNSTTSGMENMAQRLAISRDAPVAGIGGGP